MSWIKNTPKANELDQKIGLELTFFGLILVIYYFLFYQDWPIWNDQAQTHYLAWAILNGKVPYLDLIDLNWPGTIFIHLMARLIGGAEPLGLRLVDLGLVFLLIASSLWVLRTFKIPFWARILPMSLFVISYFSTAHEQTAQREMWALALLMMSVALFTEDMKHGDSKKRLLQYFFSGLAMAACLLIKPAMIFLGTALCLAKLAIDYRRKNIETKALASFFAGGMTLSLATMIILLLSGSFASFWQWGVEMMWTGSGSHRASTSIILERAQIILWRAPGLWHRPYVFILALIPLVLFFSKSRKQLLERLPVLILMASFSLAGAYHVWAHGRGYLYHFWPFLFSCSLLLSVLLSCIELPKLRQRLFSQRLQIGSISFSLLLLIFMGMKFSNYGIPKYMPSAEIARQFKSLFHEREQIVGFGAGTLPLMSQLELHTPYRFLASDGLFGYESGDSPLRKSMVKELGSAIDNKAVAAVFFDRQASYRYFVDEKMLATYDSELAAEVKAMKETLETHFVLLEQSTSRRILAFFRKEKIRSGQKSKDQAQP